MNIQDSFSSWNEPGWDRCGLWDASGREGFLAYSPATIRHASHHFRSHYLDGRTDARAGGVARVALIAVAAAAVHNRGEGRGEERRGEAAWEEVKKPRKKQNNFRTMRLTPRLVGRSDGQAASPRHAHEVY